MIEFRISNRDKHVGRDGKYRWKAIINDFLFNTGNKKSLPLMVRKSIVKSIAEIHKFVMTFGSNQVLSVQKI